MSEPTEAQLADIRSFCETPAPGFKRIDVDVRITLDVPEATDVAAISVELRTVEVLAATADGQQSVIGDAKVIGYDTIAEFDDDEEDGCTCPNVESFGHEEYCALRNGE